MRTEDSLSEMLNAILSRNQQLLFERDRYGPSIREASTVKVERSAASNTFTGAASDKIGNSAARVVSEPGGWAADLKSKWLGGDS
jgi:hypothetical protein